MAEQVLVGVGRPEKPRVTLVAAQGLEPQAQLMADQDMQRKQGEGLVSGVAKTIWKRTLFGEYFRERAFQYRREQLEITQTPFAGESITKAEQKADERYKQYLDRQNVVRRGGEQALNFLRSAVGAKTLKQHFALEELAHMRDAGEIANLAAHERETQAMVARMDSAFDQNDTLIRQELGERLEILDPTKAEHQPLITGIKDLMRRYAQGTITRTELERGGNALFKNLRPDLARQADLYASSLFQSAEAIRAQVGHNAGLEAIDAQLDQLEFRVGFAQMGAATHLEPSATRKIVNNMKDTLHALEKRNFATAAVFNEATVGSGVALALSLGYIPRSLLGSAARLVAPIGGSVVGGAFGGFREYWRLRREYLVHLREKEAGFSFPMDAKRREWFDRFYIQQRSAKDLTQAIQLPKNPTEDALRAAFANLADTKARLAISGRKDNRIGMVSFSSPEVIESERTALQLAIRQAEQKLQNADVTAVTNGQSAQEFLSKLTQAQTTVLNEGTQALDGLDDPVKRALNMVAGQNPEVDVIRRRFGIIGKEQARGTVSGITGIQKEFGRAAKIRAVRYGATAAGVGMAAGEAVSDLAHFVQTGQLEAIGPIAGSFRAVHDLLTPTPTAPADILRGTPFEQLMSRTHVGGDHWQALGAEQAAVPGAGAHIPDITIPHGTQLVANDHGSWDIVFNTTDPKYAGVKVVTDITFGPNGKLDHFTAMSLDQYHLKLDINPNQPGIPFETDGSAPGGVTTITSDRINAEGGGNLWDLIKHITQQEAPHNPQGATNALFKTFRTFERALNDNKLFAPGATNPMDHVPLRGSMWGKEVGYQFLGGKYEFRDLPDVLFSDKGMKNVAGMFQTTMDYVKTLHNAGTNQQIMDEITKHFDSIKPGSGHIYALLYRVGYMGREDDMPTPDEVKDLISFLGGGKVSVTPYATSINLQELIPAAPPAEASFVLPVGFHTPLEEILETVAPQATPTTPMEAPQGPYGPYSPYETYLTSEKQKEWRENTGKAEQRVEALINASPLLLRAEKQDAITKAQGFLHHSRLADISPLEREALFEDVWQFLASQPNFNTLISANGTVPPAILTQITAAISSLVGSQREQTEIAQVLGKFTVRFPAYLQGNAPEIEKRLQALVLAYRTAKSIISPI